MAITFAIAVLITGPAALAQGGLGELHWVGTWATSPQANSSVSFNNQTLRMIVHTSIGGHTVRVRFSNAYGVATSAGGGSLVIGAAHIALRAPSYTTDTCTFPRLRWPFNLRPQGHMLHARRFGYCPRV